ncbi:twin-arginine translocation signal domain-containing protein [Planctomycetota bacterium]
MRKSKQKAEPMHTTFVSRRQFLQCGAIATALAATGKLPFLYAQSQAGSMVDASTGPHTVKPIRDHLRRFSPGTTPMHTSPQYSLAYDIIHWSWKAGKRGTFSNSVVGRIIINRKAAESKVIFEISQRMRIGGVDNHLKANVTCNTNEWSSLREWTLHSYHSSPEGKPEPRSKLAEKGRCNGKQIRIESRKYDYGFNAENPVVTQWTFLDFLIRKANQALNVKFDLLQDLSLFKPDQSLIYDGLTPVTLKDGKTITLQTYAHTGPGVLPIHYLLDDRGWPQLVTSSILSWALSG